MTYFGFLLRFVFIPVLALLAIAVWDNARGMDTSHFDRKRVPQIILLHIILALVYTTPWDNYLVASGVWAYNPGLVTGIVFGWVPLEEYTFFVMETLFSSLWWLFLVRRGFGLQPKSFTNSVGASSGRLLASAALIVAWIISALIFFSGWKPATYLSITLFWALFAVIPQFIFGADILWHYRKLLFMAIFPVGLYLSLVDIIALNATTWSISPAQTTGLLFFEILPIEEVLFFFITNILIAFGLTLMLSDLSRQRLSAWRLRRWQGLP